MSREITEAEVWADCALVEVWQYVEEACVNAELFAAAIRSAYAKGYMDCLARPREGDKPPATELWLRLPVV